MDQGGGQTGQSRQETHELLGYCLPASSAGSLSIEDLESHGMRSSPPPHALFAIVTVLMLAGNGLCQAPFPSALPSEVGVQDEALELLGWHIQSLIADDEAVGGELHVIKQGQTIFHQAFGWADRQEQRRLEKDSIYCVRSMTKPVVGTAVQMLLDAGELSLEQVVAETLSSFARPETKQITVEQLLTHTSGLPFSTIGKPLSAYSSILEVAEEAAQTRLLFEPGTDFQYSDAGSDTLGAVVAVSTGLPPEQFIEQRILQPLAMKNSFTKLPDDALIRERIPSAYSGGTGNWQRHWHRDADPIFPIFLTSQSLYCTTSDYARFLQLWLDAGARDGRQLLTRAAIERGLRPGQRIDDFPVGFSGLQLTYGQQWMVYVDENSQPIVFGHNGSDGTHAWAWPAADLIVLFFTQTRGTRAGIELESTLERLLIQQDVDGYRADALARQQARSEWGRYAGLYWDQDQQTACYAIRLVGSQLILERPGRLRAAVKPQAEAGKFLVGGRLELEFENGDPAPAVRMDSGARSERQVRHQVAANLPSVDELNAKVRAAYGMQHLEENSVIKLSGTIKMGPLGLSSPFEQWFDARNMRSDIKGWTSSTSVIVRGTQVAVSSNGGKSFELQSGVVREQEVLAHPAVHYSDWGGAQTRMEVLKQVEVDGQQLILVRAEVNDLPGWTIFVDADSGHITAEHSLQYLPGAGYIGVETNYSDFREVAGLILPFRTESKFANPLLGRVIIQFDAFEVGLQAGDRFEIPEH